MAISSDFRVLVSGVRCQVSALPLAASVLSDRKRNLKSKYRILQRRTVSIEQGTTNVEGMYSICLIKKTEQSDSTLHHSIFLVRCSAVRFKRSFIRALSSSVP
ncbi:hypothetical protein D1AOALGA4SA_7439 [Olavius algarvensis Delta 1 endosymbiont]|nr:hypothetical protein D1AOALGA4SA_7439 [Olavius algarvensis Delta 1 endosymbiont]